MPLFSLVLTIAQFVSVIWFTMLDPLDGACKCNSVYILSSGFIGNEGQD